MTQVLTLKLRRSVDLTVVAATLSWTFLVDALGWNFLLDKLPHHDKMNFIEGRAWSRARARVCACVCVCECVCVCVCVCVYFFHLQDIRDKLEEINDLVLWILIWVLLPSFLISVSENVVFHLQRQNVSSPTTRVKTTWYISSRRKDDICWYKDMSQPLNKSTSDEKILTIRRVLYSKFFYFESSPWY